MSKKRRQPARRRSSGAIGKGMVLFLKTTLGLIWWIICWPYYLVQGVIWLTRKSEERTVARTIEHRRSTIGAHYDMFDEIETLEGSLSAWERKLEESDSTIGIALGARGSGKTAFGVRLLENIYARTHRTIYAIGFSAQSMPSWVHVVESVDQIHNNAFVLIDEGGILFNARDSMSTANKLLSDLILISRHKNLSILFISQNSANLEVNILRQADYLVLKHSSLLQKEFERKIIQKLYEKTSAGFAHHKNMQGLAYIHSSEFVGFIANQLPSFWKSSISKSFRDVGEH